MPSQKNRPITELFNKDFALFQGLGERAYVESILGHEGMAVDEFNPDIILSYLQLTASITARIKGVKQVSIARWTEHPKFTSPILEEFFGDPSEPKSGATDNFNQLLDSYDLPRVDNVWNLSFMFSDLKVAPAFEEMEPGLADVPNLHYVGYLKDVSMDENTANIPPWLTQWANSPYTKVFVYLSAKELTPDTYIPILKEAFKGTDIRAIVATGPQVNCGIPTSYLSLWLSEPLLFRARRFKLCVERENGYFFLFENDLKPKRQLFST